MEKAREVRVKADEEFAIEKVRCVVYLMGCRDMATHRMHAGETREAGNADD